ncbi:MAG: tRNA guanosine(15) transglycosylase TgtA [Candidatus Lokiarchaeota archaeon]|nr:tRNA guanosine(15) transglycosylase TgtA [Candidatus Lokiarchaeota archaeon]
MNIFEVRSKEGLARLGVLSTEHGDVRTPLLMPVVHPDRKAIPVQDLVDKYGFQMVITNSFIIHSKDNLREGALRDGVHSLLDFDGPIMTDSGTFQMYFHKLPEDHIEPLEIVRFQRDIGADMGTILDVFSEPDVGKSKVEKNAEISFERAKKSVGEKGDMLLAGTIQGGIYSDLRKRSAKQMGSLDLDIHPVGGVVPLMESYRYADIVRATLAAKSVLPLNRPVHLFGCGHPMFFALAALLGCDLFDSASYAKFAQSDRMMLPTGTVHLHQLRELPCSCPICSQTTQQELESLPDEEREIMLSKHNLYVAAAEMRRVRQAIADGKLFELAAIRARGHPELYQGLQIMLDYQSQFLPHYPLGASSSVFFTGAESARHPAFVKFHNQLVSSYPYRNTDSLMLVPSLGERPFSESFPDLTEAIKEALPTASILAFVTPIGVIPWELEHVYPAQQSVFPTKEIDTVLSAARIRLTHFLGQIKRRNVFWLDRDAPTSNLKEAIPHQESIRIIENIAEAVEILREKQKDTDWAKRKLNALSKFQWNIGFDFLIEGKDWHFSFSGSTGKIRHAYKSNTIMFTVVPTTGLLAPTFEGGKWLLEHGLDEKYIVVMEDEAAEFVAKGRSALAKFVENANDKLGAGEEVVVTNTSGRLVGTGKSNLTGKGMLDFSRGVAVDIRHSLQHSDDVQ